MTGWTWDQVRDQLDLPRVALLREAWANNPPLTITMRAAAEALGVEFNGGNLTSSAESSPAGGVMNDTTDPYALMAELGHSEVQAYVRPRMGLPIGDPIEPVPDEELDDRS